MTQKEKILKHMREHNGITNMEAFKHYGITRLSGRIYELRRDGHHIRNVPQETEDGRHYDRFVLEE